MVSSLGGVIGSLLELSASTLLSHFSGWPTLPFVDAIVRACFLSAAVGVLLELYSAKKTATSDPIDALRYQ